ncbi:MAG: protein translocase subunit SecD [Acidimicrobiales bacterium]|nr:MAG: protein translocase subunit SecD [Acidimicrobiales bacterium]
MKRSTLWAYVLGTFVVCFGALAATMSLGYAPQLGLDLQGGASVVYKPAHPVPMDTLDQAIAIIRNRVDGLGVANPNIGRQGDNIVVQLPGVKNAQRALQIVGQTAQLEFRQVLCPAPAYSPPSPATPPPAPMAPSCSANLAQVPTTSRSLDKPSATVVLPVSSASGGGREVLGPALASGTIIKTANAALNQNGTWQINFGLTSPGSATFDSIAKVTYQKQLGIVLDGLVESAPTINSQSFNGSGQITGTFTEAQAKNLALELRYGALPVQLQQQTVQTISPTLGKSSLQAGLIAGLVGLALVLAYTVVYYRAFGVVVLLGLVTTAALLWAIVSLLGVSQGLTLDLSGVTGLIVSVGITVDSYVVYFERLKDEVRAGRSVRTSVDKGFSRAFRTILAADLVSLIGAALLYLLSVAQVKGFAFYLGLSTLLDVASAYLFTRPLVILLGQSRLFTETRWLGVARGLAIPDRPVAPTAPPVTTGSRS